ncbi:hypothetical protein Taro_053512 [Colocasia esculenta]|uniref:Uncharacterized protein n=1 Tax=Colocasia esculenta TaxID=4460 RepID=A0A843XMV0_COLES|nr:hypothetical protein [Colocasia esculenta]
MFWIDESNSGIHPKTIVIDQDNGIERIVAKVFKMIGHICISNLDFMNDFDSRICASISMHEFEEK